MLRPQVLHAFILAFALGSPRLAEACGGFFCSTLPMNQVSERILFVDRGDSVTTHVQIQYSGSAADFAWILPVPSPPQLAVSHNELFRQLQFATQPFFFLEWDETDECGPVFPPFFRSLEEDAATTGDVTVVAEERVGPYDTVVLSSDDTDAILTWLVDNGYQLGDLGRELLQPYVDGGFYFVALRMAPDRELGDLQPISLSYAAETPGIPIQLTAVATQPDLGVTAWILAEARAVPTNYLHVQINEALIDWFNGGFNYDDVVQAAVDAAPEGHAFVTDYAGPSKIMDPRLRTENYDTDALARIDDAGRFLEAALRQGLPRDAQMQALLRRHMPMPELARVEGVLQVVYGGDQEAYNRARDEGFLASVAERAFYNDISAFRPWLDDDWSFDPVALAADLELVVVEPLRATQRLFATYSYLTRLYTTLSAEEMTVDPMFDVNPDLPEISNMRSARAHWECEGIDLENIDLSKLVLVVTLADGRQVRSQPFADGPWPLARETDLPAASLIERLDTSGPAVLVRRLTAIGENPAPTLPVHFGLHLAYPNPFNAATVIPFTIPTDGGAAMVRVSIHDLLGQRVRTLVSGLRPPGRQQVIWDGRSDDGAGLASGVYLVRLEVGTARMSQKILYVQ